MIYYLRAVLLFLEKQSHLQIFPHDRILSAVSDDGSTWTREGGICIDVSGAHANQMVYYPCVVAFPNLLRMYFYGSVRTKQGWFGRILSATSTDGVSWKTENSVCINYGDTWDLRIAKSPHVIKIGDRYRMYYAGSRDSKYFHILSAVSDDGIQWQKEAGIRIAPAHFGLDSVAEPYLVRFHGCWRMYFTGSSQGHERIYSAVSKDGLTWQLEAGIRIDCELAGRKGITNNPCVVRLSTGKLRMYFRGSDIGAVGSRIYSAISEDGISWTDEPGIRLIPNGRYEQHGVAFPNIVTLPNQKLRMYYTGYWGKHLLSPLTVRRSIASSKKLWRLSPMRGINNQDFRFLTHTLPEDLSGMTCLDLGCGKGLYTQELLQRGAEVIALDLNLDNVTAIRDNPKISPDLLLSGSAVQLPFQQDCFDLVICIEVLTHIPRKLHKHVLNAIKRVLKSGGQLIMSVHNKQRMALASKLSGKPVQDVYITRNSNIYPLGRSELQSLITRHGFQPMMHVECINFFNFFSYKLYKTRPMISRVLIWTEDILRKLPLLKNYSITLLIQARFINNKHLNSLLAFFLSAFSSLLYEEDGLVYMLNYLCEL